MLCASEMAAVHAVRSAGARIAIIAILEASERVEEVEPSLMLALEGLGLLEEAAAGSRSPLWCRASAAAVAVDHAHERDLAAAVGELDGPAGRRPPPPRRLGRSAASSSLRLLAYLAALFQSFCRAAMVIDTLHRLDRLGEAYLEGAEAEGGFGRAARPDRRR